MADVNLSPYTAEQQAMDRRRKMAEAMQQQAIAPIEMPTMPGVRVSPYAGLAKMFQSYVAKRNLDKSDQEQKDYENRVSEDQAKFARNMGQYETVPGEVISRGTEKTYPMKENTTPWNQNVPAVDVSAGAMPVAGQPEQRAPARQIPLLNASLLESTNPLAFKTGQGKQMLFQYLMQQEAQKQAAAQAQLAAQQQIHTAKSGETAFRLDASGNPVTVMNPPAQPKWEHTSKFVNGQEITGWVNTNAPDIPGSFVQGTIKPEMTESQRLDAQLKQYAADVEAAKSLDVGRKSTQFEPLPRGVPIGAKRIGIDPISKKPVYELNGKKFVGE
jgi:hypothetical protein